MPKRYRLTVLLTFTLLTCLRATAGPLNAYELLRRFFETAGTPELRQAARDAEGLLKAGQFTDAVRLLEKLQREQAVPKASAVPVDELIQELRSADPARWRNRAFVLDRASGPSQEVLASMPDYQLPVFRAIENVSRTSPFLTFVRTDAKKFVRGLESGWANPEAAFRRMPGSQQGLVRAWNGRPIEDRVFLIGAGKDGPGIARYIAEQEKNGKMVFFYKVCIPASGVLCPNEAIGAYMRTAGTIVLAGSPAADASRFVTVELAAVQRLNAGESMMIMLSPADILAGAEQITTKAIIGDFGSQNQ